MKAVVVWGTLVYKAELSEKTAIELLMVYPERSGSNEASCLVSQNPKFSSHFSRDRETQLCQSPLSSSDSCRHLNGDWFILHLRNRSDFELLIKQRPDISEMPSFLGLELHMPHSSLQKGGRRGKMVPRKQSLP